MARLAGVLALAALALSLGGAAEAAGPAALTISVGGLHACAIVNGPELRCWGEGGSGRLGNGANLERATPVGPVGIDQPIQQVAAGGAHTCVLTVAGGVICFGWNGNGQLGDGSTNSTGTGVYALGLQSGVQAIAAGDRHTCALTDTGGVKCWGYASSYSNSTTPFAVTGLGGVDAISAGNEYSCALTGGKLKCWVGKSPVAEIPTGTFFVWKAVSVGDGSSCAVAKSTARGGGSAVRCWGDNDYGQLGDGTKTESSSPVMVQGSDGFNAVAVGSDFACALTDAGGVKCWGRNDSGQLGDGTYNQHSTPVAVTGLDSGVQAISAGTWSACALTATGEVDCWGNGAAGQLGDGSKAQSRTPVSVAAIGPRTLTINVLTGSGVFGYVSISPGGIGFPIDCLGSSCKAGWANGAYVKLTAVPQLGSSFTGWSGACSGSALTCFFAVDSDTSVTATFAAPTVAGPKAYDLTVTKAGAGSGTVTSNPAGVSCGADCKGQLAFNASVTLTATAAVGSVFSGWGGACSGTDSKCTLTMSTDRAATATFAAAGSAGSGSSDGSSSGGGSSGGGAGSGSTTTSSSAGGGASATTTTAAAGRACTLPDVRGQELAAARSAIRAARCQVWKIRRAYSSKVGKGRVISQDPAPGTSMRVGGRVSLVVSRGPKRRS